MQRLFALVCLCLLSTAWSALAQAQQASCPNLQAAVDSVMFPQEAVALRITEGKAVVALTIRADGEVVDATVTSATHPVFGTAALSIVSRLRCNRRATSLRTTLPVNFDLFGGAGLLASHGCKQTLPESGDEPGFPREAMQAGLDRGEVVIDFKVDDEGRPVDIVVVKSTHPWFSRSAYRFIELLDCKGAEKNKLMTMPFGYRLE
jgi:TonB family protein